MFHWWIYPANQIGIFMHGQINYQDNEFQKGKKNIPSNWLVVSV